MTITTINGSTMVAVENKFLKEWMLDHYPELLTYSNGWWITLENWKKATTEYFLEEVESVSYPF